MISRRRFLISFGALPIVALPAFGVAALTAMVAESQPAVAALEVTDEIRALERLVADTPGFSWYAHNELRHHYLPISERESRKHADILLSHAVMDDYVLNTLSDWRLTHYEGNYSPQLAIETLVDNADRYGEFPHLRAACLLLAGDTYRTLGNGSAANAVYRLVSADASPLRSMRAYRTLAMERLLA